MHSSATFVPSVASYLVVVVGVVVVMLLVNEGTCAHRLHGTKSGSSSTNDRPIIGILSQPTNGENGSSYIAASYVKFMESGGARVVPILYNYTTQELDHLFDSINGVMFTGGGSDLIDTQLYRTGKYLYDKALEANNNGDYFPILGHCMGFELLAIITSQDFNILSGVDAENLSLPLNFIYENVSSSKWLGAAPVDVLNILATQPVTLNNHVQCVTPTDFNANPYLRSFYSVLSTNVDRSGVEFISTWEAIKYPVYGIQWHAEKPQFEWYVEEVINHSSASIYAMQYFANYFVNEARKSSHKFASQDEEFNTLIYNYTPVYSEGTTPSFEQVYIF